MAEITQSVEDEWFLDVNTTLLQNNSFSCDFGASLTKVVCVVSNIEKTRLYFRSFQKTDEAVDYIQARVGDSLDTTRPVNVTGIKSHLHLDSFESRLGIKLHNKMEFDAIVDGASFFLKHCQLQDMTYEKTTTAIEYGTKSAKQLESALDSITATGRCHNWKSFTPESDTHKMEEKDDSEISIVYPAMIVHLGSGSIFGLVEEDGTYWCLDFLATSGKTLLGLASLLTDSTTFHDLEEKAKKGQAKNLNITVAENFLGPTEITEDSYTNLSELDYNLYCFGKAVGKKTGDFSSPDLAAAVVKLVAEVLATNCIWQSMAYKVQQIIFSGGLVSGSAVFREHLTGAMETKCRANPMGHGPDFYLMKYGAYFAAVGALL